MSPVDTVMPPPRSGSAFRDNVEAFAVAIAMALVIRHFCIEAFRIPTGSMMPTLLGDSDPSLQGRRPGDRILVDKIAWLRRDPRRWEVAVFQYPLNRSKNFIKRIAGMPDEWLRIVDGDIWTSKDRGKSWHIQRKPAGVRDQLFFGYWPEPTSHPDRFRPIRCWAASDEWSVDEEQARFKVAAGAALATVEFTRKVLPYDSVDDDEYSRQPFVGDVRVSFEVEDLKRESGGELVVRIIKHGVSHRLVLGDKSYVEYGVNKARRDVPHELESGEVSFALSDGRLLVDIDGDLTEFELPERTQPPEEDFFDGKWMHHSIRMTARKCRATLADVRIDRDVHYTGDETYVWKIPKGHYFMLGDNTQSSKDSRLWVIAEAHHNNGEVIRWEVDRRETRNPPGGEFGGPDADVFVEADIEGHTRRFKNRDIKHWESQRRWPFVSRDHLIGRAFSVFWPIWLPPLSKGPTRVKTIR